MPDTDRNPDFAAAVERALAGRTQREVRRLTGISATYVGDMIWGKVPSYRVLERLARGLELRGEVVRELFESAAYAPPPDLARPAEGAPRAGKDEPPTPRQYFDRRFGDLVRACRAAGVEAPEQPRFNEASLTFEGVDRHLEELWDEYLPGRDG